jgi:cell division topological specificity factor
MSWFFPFSRRRSASVARERLQILLTHERGADSRSDLIPILREEVLAVVAKHVSIDVDKVQVKIERGKAVSLLEIDIEIPADAETSKRKEPASQVVRSRRLATVESRATP